MTTQKRNPNDPKQDGLTGNQLRDVSGGLGTPSEVKPRRIREASRHDIVDSPSDGTDNPGDSTDEVSNRTQQ
jgi:hypothetical protein